MGFLGEEKAREEDFFPWGEGKSGTVDIMRKSKEVKAHCHRIKGRWGSRRARKSYACRGGCGGQILPNKAGNLNSIVWRALITAALGPDSHVLVLPFVSWVVLDKWNNLSKSQFPHAKFLQSWYEGQNDATYIEWFLSYTCLNRCSINDHLYLSASPVWWALCQDLFMYYSTESSQQLIKTSVL